MTLQRVKTQYTDGWSSKFGLENTKIRHELPVLVGKPNINYSALKQLCSIDGLGNRKKSTTKEAHAKFMKNYSSIFHNGEDKLPQLDIRPHDSITEGKLQNGSTQSIQGSSHQDIYIPHDHRKPHYCATYNIAESHDIRDHLSALHKQHTAQTRDDILKFKITSLRKLLKKLPFERKRSDQEAIFSHLRFFKELTDQIPLEVLKEMSGIVQIERWNDAGYTVFSNEEVNLILRGSVTAINEKMASLQEPFREHLSSSGEETNNTEKLIVGQCFGSLDKIDDLKECGSHNPRICSVVTLGPCEFIKISSRDFEKMKQLVHSKETTRKLHLVQSCRLFENWPKVALNKIVDMIGWKVFHPGQTLVNEGESCHVIGFINRGFCLLKRSIDVAKTHKDGTKNRRQKQVTVGKLGPGDSFGECTVLRDQPIPYSIVTISHLQLGIITEQDFNEVDEVTKCLLRQCYEAIDSNMSEEELQKQYVDQQKQNEWIKFKRHVVRDVILYRSILPGYGKWSRNPTVKDVIDLV